MTSPGGERFEVVRRAGAVAIHPAPYISADGAVDLVSVKDGTLFACSAKNGDMAPAAANGEGVYAHDTRFLCELRLLLGDKDPILLSSSSSTLGYLATFDLTNPRLDAGGEPIEQMSLNIRRARMVKDRLFERVTVRNHGKARARTTVTLELGADFADIFEVRGVRRRLSRGQVLGAKRSEAGVRFAYLGEDGLFRETTVELAPPPSTIDCDVEGRAAARWDVGIPPGASVRIDVGVEASVEGRRAPAADWSAAHAAAERDYSSWRDSCTRIRTSQSAVNHVFDATIRDVHLLRTVVEGEDILVAGVPWYVAPFGRDALVTSQMILLLNPEEARRTLLYLARHQATREDPVRDAEPGKILHELRVGELARAGHIVHTPYYGSVDATPLFLMLAARYHAWTGDAETMAALRPHIEAALEWIDVWGDGDGDGFVEYRRRSPGGLDNQGWKDSEDCIVHRDGTRATGPIALAEVQGYVYEARRGIAGIYRILGDHDAAARLDRSADELRDAFDEAFWMPEENTYALALDGHNEQVGVVASNAGHCLYTGVVREDKAASVAERLMAPDMFSGWGIRTLSRDARAYNPMSYHNGSVWPHDNAIIAAGFKRYGVHDAAQRIAAALFDAALAASEARLPELYCGFNRRPGASFVRYPVACSPQAWAAAAPVMLLQALLGLVPSAPLNTLTIDEPHLPEWLPEVRLDGLRVGGARLSLRFTQSGEATSLAVLDKTTDLRINLQA